MNNNLTDSIFSGREGARHLSVGGAPLALSSTLPAMLGQAERGDRDGAAEPSCRVPAIPVGVRNGDAGRVRGTVKI